MLCWKIKYDADDDDDDDDDDIQNGLRDERNVCLSVKCVNCDKTKEISAEIVIPYKRPIHLVS